MCRPPQSIPSARSPSSDRASAVLRDGLQPPYGRVLAYARSIFCGGILLEGTLCHSQQLWPRAPKTFAFTLFSLGAQSKAFEVQDPPHGRRPWLACQATILAASTTRACRWMPRSSAASSSASTFSKVSPAMLVIPAPSTLLSMTRFGRQHRKGAHVCVMRRAHYHPAWTADDVPPHVSHGRMFSSKLASSG